MSMSKVQRLRGLTGRLFWTATLVAGCGSTSSTAAPIPTSTPGPQTAAPPPALTETFTSGLYGYSISYPAGFAARSATKQLQGAAVPRIDGEEVDQLGVDQLGGDGLVVMSSAVLPPGTATLDEWTAATAIGFCGQPARSEAVLIGGEAATMSTFATCRVGFHQWVTAVRGAHGYHVVWVRERGHEASDRALFLAMLQTFTFGPEPTPPRPAP